MCHLGALDLAALLCSRVCHDLISPVGAIVNGLEVLEEDKDEETKTFALDLIKKSAQQASAKLQFCRLAFGAAGSAGAQIETGDAERVARGLIEDGKTTIAWNLPRELVAKNRVKLLLNMLVIAAGAIPRGGTLTVDALDGGYRVVASGLNARLTAATAELIWRHLRPYRRRARHSAGLYGDSGPRLRIDPGGCPRGRNCGRNRALGGLLRGGAGPFILVILRFLQPKLNPLATHYGPSDQAVAPGDDSARRRARFE